MIMSHHFQWLSVFIFLVDISLSAKILCVFLVPFYSHQKVLRIFPEELAKLGHEIVIITPEPIGVLTGNITEIDIRKVTHEKLSEIFANDTNSQKQYFTNPIHLTKFVYQNSYTIAEAQLNHPDVKSLIGNKYKQFDLILAEESAPAAVIFNAGFDAPIVLVSSCAISHESFQDVGSETNPLLFPFNQKTPASFLERISIFLEAMRIKYIISKSSDIGTHMLKKYYGKDAPTMEDVRKNVKMLFLTVKHMWDNNRAVGPAVNYMGDIHLEKPKPLPEDLQRYLDSSNNGVILMCFGSNNRNSNLLPHTLGVILKVFAFLPYDVIWKWNGGDLPYLPKNVRVEKWIPQADLLRHPAIKLYITHGGLQSTGEAIAANVPLLGLPLLGDQFHNVKKYEEYGIGIGMDIDKLDENELRKTILNIVTNETYRKNIRRLSSILSDQRVNGLQRALHQIQYLLDHDFPLQSPAANISFAEYFMLDVFGPIVLAIFLTFVATGYTIYTKTPYL